MTHPTYIPDPDLQRILEEMVAGALSLPAAQFTQMGRWVSLVGCMLAVQAGAFSPAES
jgi:hypothetical protein